MSYIIEKSVHALRGLVVAVACLPLAAQAFESGSTSADGAFNPTVNTVLQVPAGGVFNFTHVNIPSGVTVSFQRNQTNTPVTLLASGDVTIAGTLHVNGTWSTPVGSAGDGNIGDDGLPGLGGPGGYDGGRGGAPAQTVRVESGHGPGGGGGGAPYGRCSWSGSGGAGGGFGSSGGHHRHFSNDAVAFGGSAYGSQLLLPLVGGSGGGGGSGGSQFHGSGGAGGGGAILIAASGTVQVTGAVRADGGRAGGANGGNTVGATGGGGSGGAIRIIATQISGNGTLSATGAAYRQHGSNGSYCAGGAGGQGRIRLEAETFSRTANTTPNYSFGEPSTVFIAGLPSLRITSVAGQAAPVEPTGNADIVLDVDTPNPVVIEFETTGVPVGNTVSLRVSPASGNVVDVVSPALTGTTELATASVSVNLPDGPSVLLAQTTYTIIAPQGDELARHTGGERVERVRLAAGFDGSATVTLITVSGKEFTLPSSRLPAMPAAS